MKNIASLADAAGENIRSGIFKAEEWIYHRYGAELSRARQLYAMARNGDWLPLLHEVRFWLDWLPDAIATVRKTFQRAPIAFFRHAILQLNAIYRQLTDNGYRMVNYTTTSPIYKLV